MPSVSGPAANKPLRVAMVGLGYFGQYQMEAWERIPEASLTALADPSGQARQAIAGKSDIGCFAEMSMMLDHAEYDLLDIATPPSTHADLLTQAIGRVPTIICQKPFCTSLAEAEAMVDLAEEAGTRLIVHENFRFMPWYRAIAELIQSGVLGDIRQAHFRLRPGDGAGDDAYLARQPYFRDMKRFLVHETGIHWIDVFRYLFGEPKTVFAELWKSNPVLAGEDSGYLIFGFDGGMRALLDANRTLDHAAENTRLTMGEFILEGTKGTLLLNGSGAVTLRATGEIDPVAVQYAFEDRNFGGDCVFHFQRHVVDHLTIDAPLETAARDYLANLKIEEAVYRSAEKAGRIDFG